MSSFFLHRLYTSKYTVSFLIWKNFIEISLLVTFGSFYFPFEQLGNQLILHHRTREAMKAFRTAMKLDETSVPALTGWSTKTEILTGKKYPILPYLFDQTPPSIERRRRKQNYQ